MGRLRVFLFQNALLEEQQRVRFFLASTPVVARGKVRAAVLSCLCSRLSTRYMVTLHSVFVQPIKGHTVCGHNKGSSLRACRAISSKQASSNLQTLRIPQSTPHSTVVSPVSSIEHRQVGYYPILRAHRAQVGNKRTGRTSVQYMCTGVVK